jgi:hypothetical protein
MDSPEQPGAANSTADVEEGLVCPMCEYSLRGLEEPRCPECGFTFLWVDLLDPARRRHPYIFEHHPNRNVWSFVKTLLGSLLPGRFWGSLLPSQPSRPRRLWLYATITTGIAFVTLAFELLRETIQTHGELLQAGIDRATFETWWFALRYAWVNDGNFVPPTVFTAVLPAWSLLTYWTMMIFGTSMHLAKVNPTHVRRCIIYCQDVCVWYGLAVIAIVLTAPRDGFRGGTTLVQWAGVALLTAVLIFGYRLCQAFRRYMRFPHAIATVISTQLIAGLVVANLLLIWLLRGHRH